MKWFKCKYKKSEWFEGLLECEALYKAGNRMVEQESQETCSHLWLTYGDSGKIGINVGQNYWRVVGFLDYIDHFKNNLK